MLPVVAQVVGRHVVMVSPPHLASKVASATRQRALAVADLLLSHSFHAKIVLSIVATAFKHSVLLVALAATTLAVSAVVVVVIDETIAIAATAGNSV